MSISREVLAAFAAVARSGSVGKAAAALNSTQPTVSRQVRSLERDLGQPLFERDSSGMHLTAAGHELVPRARLILHELELARDALDAHRGLRRGAIRVGGVTTLVRTFMPAILAEVTARAPELKIEVMDASEEQLDRALAQREVDLVFATRPPSEVEAIEVGSTGFTDRCVVFCASNHPLTVLERPPIEAILKQKWALDNPGATTRQQLQSLVATTGYAFPSVGLQTASVDLIILLVSKSLILGWLPEPLLGVARETGAIAVLPTPKLELVRTFRAYRRSRGTIPAGVQVFLDAMAAVRR